MNIGSLIARHSTASSDFVPARLFQEPYFCFPVWAVASAESDIVRPSAGFRWKVLCVESSSCCNLGSAGQGQPFAMSCATLRRIDSEVIRRVSTSPPRSRLLSSIRSRPLSMRICPLFNSRNTRIKSSALAWLANICCNRLRNSVTCSTVIPHVLMLIVLPVPVTAGCTLLWLWPVLSKRPDRSKPAWLRE